MGRKLDLKGQRFERLLAIEEAGKSANGGILWHCLCDCGKEKVVEASNLRAGITKSCGCLQRERAYEANVKDIAGEIFQRLTAVSRGNKNSNGSYEWLCRCICGTLLNVDISSLLNGHTGSCGCLVRENARENLKKALANVRGVCRVDIYRQALRGGRYGIALKKEKGQISEDQAVDLMRSNCFYCGVEPSTLYERNGRSCFRNGIDRIDSSCSYKIDNVVPCCSRCNSAKMSMPIEDFVEHIERIHRHLQSNPIGPRLAEVTVRLENME